MPGAAATLTLIGGGGAPIDAIVETPEHRDNEPVDPTSIYGGMWTVQVEDLDRI
jgi:hypothetical protein